MRLLCKTVWPRSSASWKDFLLVLATGLIAGLGVALALGSGSAVIVGQERASVRDGPRGLEPTFTQQDRPLRATRHVVTAYGSATVLLLVGDPDEKIDLPGIPRIAPSGTVQVSPAVAQQLADDWSGELGAYVGSHAPKLLEPAALAHPDELLIVTHFAEIPEGTSDEFRTLSALNVSLPQGSEARGIVIVGLCVLLLPCLALGRAGVAVHLNRRKARYSLLRRLGLPPNRLRIVVAADLGLPWFVGITVALGGFSVAALSDAPFRLAGVSYWWSDMQLSVTTVLSVGLAAAVVLVLASARTIAAICREPLGDSGGDLAARRFRGTPVMIAVAPILAFYALRSNFSPVVAQLMVAVALLMAVIGLGPAAEFVTKAIGRLLHQRRWSSYAGARMLRRPQATLAGLAGASVAMMSIAFVVQASFNDTAEPTGDFDAVAEIFNVNDRAEAETAAASVASLRGITNVTTVSRAFKLADGHKTLVYGASCDGLRRIADLPDGCQPGMAYIPDVSQRNQTVIELPDTYGFGNRERPGAIVGTYPMGGRISASWVGHNDIVVSHATPDADPIALSLLFITTDGSDQGLRSVLVGSRAIAGVSRVLTRSAMGAETSWENNVLEPFLLLMGLTAAAIAAGALLYTMIALFRQQEHQFATMRAIGQTRRALAIDLSVLFVAPLAAATLTALGTGTLLAFATNLALDANHRGLADHWGIAAALITVAAATTTLVWIQATRVEPLTRDPEATL